MEATVRPGSRVTLHYTLSLKDGTVADSTLGGPPAEFRIGDGGLLEVLEQRLVGLQAGDRRHFEIAADETASAMTDETRQRLPRADFPPELELRPGQVLGFTAPDGEEIPGWVMDVTGEDVLIDFAHPLTARDLVFDVEIIAIETG